LHNLANAVKKAAYKTKCSLVVIDSITKAMELGYTPSGEVEDINLRGILSALEVCESASIDELIKALPGITQKDIDGGLKELAKRGYVGYYNEAGTPKYYSRKTEAAETKNRAATRQDMCELMVDLDELRDLGVTLIYTGEADKSEERITLGGVAEFECDGVIILSLTNLGEEERSIQFVKMRSTKIDTAVCDLKFTDQGIKIAHRG
jgi:hypothetical protein